MELTFLGTSAGVPTRQRGLTSMALRFDDGRIWLVDCGEGTQHRLLGSSLRASRIERVLLTHLHGDHCFGLPGLLASLGLWGRRDPVEVVGPHGLREWLETTLRVSGCHLAFPLTLRELDEGGSALGERDGLALSAHPLVHRVPSYAYVVREAPRRGHVDAQRARSLGVPEGPLLGRLAAGEAVVLPDGRQVESAQVLGPPRPGRVVAVCGDSSDSSSLLQVPGLEGCDLLVHEATYDGSRAAQAAMWSHSTTEQVAELARALRPRCLAITHLSARYTVEGASRGAEALRKEVEAGCPGIRVALADDGLVLPVPPREDEPGAADEERRRAWDARYGASACVWGAGPNRFLQEAFAEEPPAGRALDLACGEGRNAIWLAERGWRVTAVDFSQVAIDRARRLADERSVKLELVLADVTRYPPEPEAFALVVVAYLQIPAAARRRALAAAAAALAPGGRLFAIGHALRNLAEGSGGPQDPAVLWDPADLAAELREAGLAVDEIQEVLRPTATADRPAVDLRIHAHRPTSASDRR